jgi:hypothetical protein
MTLEDLEKHLLRTAAQVPRLKTAADAREASQQREAEAMLRDPHTTATGCFRAAEVLCGNGFRAWEPDSLWLTLDRRGVDVPLLNRDKLLAAVTMSIVPAFWWEVNAFENTIMAFNNVVSNPEIMQEATPAQIAWAVYEAELLYGQIDDMEDTPYFDREPVLYTAVVLHRAGFLRPPDILGFAQTALQEMNKNGTEVSLNDLDTAWSKMRKMDLDGINLGETPLEIQLGRLAAVQLYIEERRQQYGEDVSRLLV